MFSETCMSKTIWSPWPDCPPVGEVQVLYSLNGMELPISIILEKRLRVRQSRNAGEGNSRSPTGEKDFHFL